MTRLSLPALAVLAALATPAMADPATDYARLREAMPTLLFGTDVALHVQVQTEVLKRLQGRWVAVSPLMTDGVTFPDEEGLKTLCSKLAFEVAPNGVLGLTMTMATKAEPYVIRMDYVGGTTYLSTVDEAGILARIFPGKDADEIDPLMLFSSVVRSTWKGYVGLIPVSNDLVLVQPLAAPPELLARCP